ncbi:MAG: hypothetical protein IPO00_05940 [Betaproteobacteria bacterium]|nr:hypothetical protein [Betaproteobacteria bacterium]
MQALLSFEQAPPIAAPFRFFLTAPLFSGLAGLLLVVNGGEIFASRWTPGALAVTHLLTVGFMLQVMLGAMIQILPVVAGANLRQPLRVAGIVHVLMLLGTLALAGGFLGVSEAAFPLAISFLGGGVIYFLLMAGLSLRGVPSTSATIAGIKRALLALLIAVMLGFSLTGGLEGRWPIPLLEVTRVHVAWGLGAWATGLLSAVAYVVVPMFQITPAYPAWFSRTFGIFLLAAVAAASLAVFGAVEWLAALLESTVVWLAAGFCATTLWLQSRSKRARPDTTQRFWRLAMLCGLVACALWGMVRLLPTLADDVAWPLLFGVLVLVGGFMSVISGMLYKIVPFLVWLHLQNRGQSRVVAPNMKAVLAEGKMTRHLYAHCATCCLLLLAVVWPSLLTRPAGLAMLVASAFLAHNLISAAGVYRHHAALVDARLAELAAGGAG